MRPTNDIVSAVVASAALIAGAAAACSGALRPGATDHESPETGGAAAGDAGSPAASGDLHATYQGRCAGPDPRSGEYQVIDVGPVERPADPTHWKGQKVTFSGIVETDVQCTEHDVDCAGGCCQSCWSDARIAGIVLDRYLCTGTDCGTRCNVPERALLAVWGTLDEASATGPVGPDPGTKYRPIITQGTWVLRVDGSCMLGRGDVNPADVAKEVTLAPGECFSHEDCRASGSGEVRVMDEALMCSLNHSGVPYNARDTCLSDADCSGARERCVETSRGRACTVPGVCEGCCKP